jgi:hypothetical protein
VQSSGVNSNTYLLPLFDIVNAIVSEFVVGEEVMAKIFSVRTTSTKVGFLWGGGLMALPGLLAAIIVSGTTSGYQKAEGWRLASGAGGLIVTTIASVFVKSLRSGKDSKVSLSINELSVQISTSRRGKVVGHPIMIPRRDILDIVVHEVILSHKVVSLLIFRVLKPLPNNLTPTQERKLSAAEAMFQEGRIRLQVAFPGTEMSYAQCLSLRDEISSCLLSFKD